MKKTYIGIDNGVTGSIGIITDRESKMLKVPVKSEQSYTKSKQTITRINYEELYSILSRYNDSHILVIMERPMVNPMRFKASVSALRCLEAVLICIEQLGYPRMYCDSKDWQTELLPHSVVNKIRRSKKKRKLNIREKVKNKQKAESRSLLKKQSLDIAKRLFPKLDFSGFEDGDSILIAEWARRKNL